MDDFEQFRQDTRDSLAALAQGHNELRQAIAGITETYSLVMQVAQTQHQTASVLRDIAERLSSD